MAPMMNADWIEIHAQGQVTATRPAKAPLSAIVASHLPNISRAVIKAAMQPIAAAALVLIVTLAI